jgi:hypothetical protein
MAEPAKETSVPTDPTNPAVTPAGGAGEGAQSKKGAKKAAAKAEKEAKKAAAKAEREAAAIALSSGPSEDLAKDNYGDITPKTKVEAPSVHLRELGEEHVGKEIKVRTWIQNARMQGAKMAFVELREEGNWTVQSVVAATADGQGVSRQMVKWIGALKLESFVLVEATVQKPLEPVKSTKVSGYELHLKRVYLIAPAPEMLGLGLGAASRAVGRLDEEDEPSVEGMSMTQTAREDKANGMEQVSASQKAHQLQVLLPTSITPPCINAHLSARQSPISASRWKIYSAST